MKFLIFPDRLGDAAENMALDFLMLQRFTPADAFRFRHYEWRRPAFTFGLSQKIDFIRQQLPEETLDISRRATGGGLVDHREDWTYALVIPRKHDLCQRPGPNVYRQIHAAMVDALNQQSAGVCLEEQPPETPMGICFTRAEINDVVLATNGTKVAGAAMKRNKKGLLFQGSIWKPLLPGLDWERFAEAFPASLAKLADAEIEYPGWPDFDPDEETALIDQYASPEWIEAR